MHKNVCYFSTKTHLHKLKYLHKVLDLLSCFYKTMFENHVNILIQ